MGIQVVGSTGLTAEVAGATFDALKTTNMPTEYGANGHYSYGGLSGIIPAALAANSEIFQFRWTDATRLCCINEIRISACVTTTFFAAGVPVQIDLIKSTGWSSAGTGGTAVTPAATIKKRTSMASTLVAAGDIRIATTAALGAGTKTLEANSLAAIVAPGPITASLNGLIIAPGTMLFRGEASDGQHPIVLAANEGISVRSVAVPATGTWQVAIQVDWCEVDAF